MFEQRVPFNAAPATPRSTSSVDPFGQRRGVEPSLIDLVKTLASQIYGCAYCLDMLSKDADHRAECELHLLLGFAMGIAVSGKPDYDPGRSCDTLSTCMHSS